MNNRAARRWQLLEMCGLQRKSGKIQNWLMHPLPRCKQMGRNRRGCWIIFKESYPLSRLFLLLVILDIYQPSPLLENFPGEDIVSFKRDWWKHKITETMICKDCALCKLKGWMSCCVLLPSTDNSSNANIYTFSQLNKYAHERMYEKTDLHHCNALIHPGQDRIHLIVPVCVWIQLKYTHNYLHWWPILQVKAT